MINYYDCPACKKAMTHIFDAHDENQKISDQIFSYYECKFCKSLFLKNVPENLSNYYRNEYYKIPNKEKLQKIALKEFFKIKLVNNFSKGKRLLEIGPAFGVFAYQAVSNGYHVDAIEMSTQCCEFLKNTVGVHNVINSNNPATSIHPNYQYDVIALWHVIEHLINPIEVLEKACKAISRDGILVIATPNPESFQFMIMGKLWPHLDAPRHVSLLSHNLIKKVCTSFGFSEVYFSTNDTDAKRWNFFGWQRLLMNSTNIKLIKYVYFILGWFISIFMMPFESINKKGSAYTLVLRKN